MELSGYGAEIPSSADVQQPELTHQETPMLAELVKRGDLAAVCQMLEELRRTGGDQAIIAEVSNTEEGVHDSRIVHSPLHIAARKGLSDIVQIFLSTRVNPNIKNDQLNTPLHFAAESGRCDCVELLLHAGADPLIRNG